MANPILEAAVLIGAGTAGAMAARAARLPAAAGSLAAAGLFVQGWRLLKPDAVRADLSFVLLILLAFLGLLAGASVDIHRLLRDRRGIPVDFAARAAAVAVSVWLIGLGLGLDGRSAIILAAAAMALSPAAVAAVTGEMRARGDLTQDLLAAAPASLLLSVVATALIVTPPRVWLLLASLVPAGAACGLVILIPLSRMATRGAVLAGAGMGAVLLAGVATRVGAPGASVMLMSILAGSMAGSLIPNRAIVRDALGDLGTPCAIALFALAAPVLMPPRAAALLPAALLVVGGRLAGLLLPGILAGRGAAAIAGAAARLPMAGMLAASVLAMAPAGSPIGDERLPGVLLLAGFLSEAAGMAGTRWALAASGEAPARDHPDAWRAAMR